MLIKQLLISVLSDSFWAMKRGWCHLCHLWVEAWKAQVWFSSLSLFCPRSCMFKRVHMEESHWPLTTVGCDECVCVCIWVCVYVCICVCVYVYMCVCVRFGGHFFQQQSRVSSDGYKGKEDLKRRQNLSHEAGTFLDLVFLLCLHPKLLPLISPCFLCWAWFSVTISDWPTTRSKSCIRAPALGISVSLYITLCWQLGSVSQICLSILTFILKQLLFPLRLVQSIISDLIFTFHQSCTNERVACAFCFSLISWRNLIVHYCSMYVINLFPFQFSLVDQ